MIQLQRDWKTPYKRGFMLSRNEERIETKSIQDTINESVPYIVHEGTVARHERTIRRLIIALIISIILIFSSNAIWLHYIQQYDFQNYEYSQDGEGVNVLGDGNGVNYNEPEVSDPKTPTEEPQES